MGKTKKNAVANKSLNIVHLESVKNLLDKCQLISGPSKGDSLVFQNLTQEESEELWSKLLLELKKFFSSSDLNIDGILEVLSVLDIAIKTDIESSAVPAALVKIMKYLNRNVSESDDKIKGAVCKLNEIWLAKKDWPTVGNMTEFTFCYLLSEVVNNDAPTAVSIKRLYTMALTSTSTIAECNLPAINKALRNSTFVLSLIGQKFLGHIAALSENLFQNMFKMSAIELSSCKADVAKAYGKVSKLSWYNADDNLKEFIQSKFRWFMESFIKMDRTSLALAKRAYNVLLVINEWNVEVRQKGSDEFAKMITGCYEPILWNNLQNGMNYQRANAADLFLKAFPLHGTGDNAAEVAFINKQVKYMKSALHDDCPVVRIIAIREVLNILSVYWGEFTAEQIRELVAIITQLEAKDTSSFEVRRTVWRGLTSFVNHELPFRYLKKLLVRDDPTQNELAVHFRDKVASVRIAFIQLLIAIRDKRDPNFKYTQFVPIDTCLKALVYENKMVGRLLVKLVMPSIYHKDMDSSSWVRKFCKLIIAYRYSYRNFFMYSAGVLSFNDAATIICELLLRLGQHVKDKRVSDDDNENSPPNVPNNSRNSNASNMSKTQESSVVDNSFDNPDIVVGLFDIMTILWSLHHAKFESPANIKIQRDLHYRYVQFGQHFISYYKDTPIFNSVVSLSGNVGEVVLKGNSITLPGYCMKMLKTSNQRSTEDTLSLTTLLIALVKWGYGCKILEQITMWLEAAFSSIDESMAQMMKKVKISEEIEPNSLLAIELLNTAFNIEYVKAAVLRKNYDQLLELWKLTGKVKDLLYRRFLRRKPYSESLLSDEFLLACFNRHVMLIPLLQRAVNPDEIENAEESFNSQDEVKSVIKWMQDDLLPLLQMEEKDCPDLDMLVKVGNDVLSLCDNMIAIGYLHPFHNDRLLSLAVSLITCDYNLHFVKGMSRLLVVLNFAAYVKIQRKESAGMQLRSTVVPSLYSSMLNALVTRPYSNDTFREMALDMAEVRKNIGKILGLFEVSLKAEKSMKTLREINFLIDKIIQVVRVVMHREVPRSDMTIPVYSSLGALPAPVAVVLFPIVKSSSLQAMFIRRLKEQLGTTIKTLLLDILIMRLLATTKDVKVLKSLQITHDAAYKQLNDFKKARRRSGVANQSRLSLSHAQVHASHVSDEDEEDSMPTSQPFTLPSTREGSDGSTRGLFSRDSDPISNMATAGTESLMSHPTYPTIQSLPTVNTQPDPQATNELESESAGVGSQPVASQGTVWSSQPASSQQATIASSQPLTCTPPQLDDIPEEELIDDYIDCGEKLLKDVSHELKKPVRVRGQTSMQ